MKTGKRSATPMTIQPYRGVDQQPMSITPSKLSTKVENAALLEKHQVNVEPVPSAKIEGIAGVRSRPGRPKKHLAIRGIQRASLIYRNDAGAIATHHAIWRPPMVSPSGDKT